MNNSMFNFVKYFSIIVLFSTALNLSAQSWMQIQTTGNPSPVSNASSIYISAENKIILFGGRTSAGVSNEVWNLNLNTNEWQNITPPSGLMPAPRFTANAVYDSLMNRMIIWSGQGSQLYNDVWAFNLSNNSWQELWPDGNVSGAPLKRYGTAAVFDPLNRRLINFAGFTTSGRFEDTWYFQIDSMRWIDKTNSFHPELRCLHSACISTDLQKMIVYGGQHNGALDDIWSLNLNSFVWTNISPVIKPSGRWFSPVIYTNSNNVVVFGGENSQTIHGDLWKYSINEMRWDSVNQGAIKPAARWGHTSVYIPASDKMIIFGGADPAYKNDTWMFTNIGSVGINNISSAIPDKFTLHQNYPNPFNPVTNLEFGISDLGFVSLKIYDMLGKEVETLINSFLNPGTHTYNFDASGFSSGIYFYTLKVNLAGEAVEFIETKKMILSK